MTKIFFKFSSSLFMEAFYSFIIFLIMNDSIWYLSRYSYLRRLVRTIRWIDGRMNANIDIKYGSLHFGCCYEINANVDVNGDLHIVCSYDIPHWMFQIWKPESFRHFCRGTVGSRMGWPIPGQDQSESSTPPWQNPLPGESLVLSWRPSIQYGWFRSSQSDFSQALFHWR